MAKVLGMDIWGAASSGGIYFQQGQAMQITAELPCFTLSYCGADAATKDCIDQVLAVRNHDPEGWQQLEAQMRLATAGSTELS